MSCIVLNFMIVFLMDTKSYEIAIKQECWKKGSEDKSVLVYELEESFKKVDIISYDHKNQFYYAKLKD